MTSAQPDQSPAANSAVVTASAVVREFQRGDGRFFQSETPTIRAVDDVSLGVDSGELVGIAGPSGSGKSTLLHLLAGLDVPTAGTVTLAGTDTSTLSERQRASLRLAHVGIVFQRFHLLPAVSARTNVALPLLEQGIRRTERRERATARLEAVGLDDRLTHKPSQLSGGEQQRVALARALVTDPDLVVADEPTGELDSETSDRVLSTLADVADGRAVVLASHDRQALAVCDRVLQLRDGTLVDAD